MTSTRQTATKIVILVLVYALALLPGNAISPDVVATRQIGSQVPSAARLITRRDQPIFINGQKLATGAIVLTGATVETPKDVGATLALGSLWTLDLAPETKLTVNFQDSTVNVMLSQGRALLDVKKGIAATFNTRAGQAAVNDASGDSFLDVSFPLGVATPTVSRQAVASTDAGAASAAASCPPARVPKGFDRRWYYLIPILAVPIIVLTRRGGKSRPIDPPISPSR